MSYALREGISACVPDRRAILMDTIANRYFQLPEQRDEALQRWLQNAPLSDDDRGRLDELVKCAILVKTPGYDLPPKCVTDAPRATRDLDIADVDPTVWAIASAIGLQIYWALQVKRFPIARIVSSVRQCERDRQTVMNVTVHRRIQLISASFRRADRILGNHDRCLIRSLALGSSARAHGLAASVIIGVQSDPFAAHCWVQIGDVVINDCCRNVRPFTPILAF